MSPVVTTHVVQEQAVNLRINSIGGSGCAALAEALLGAESLCRIESHLWDPFLAGA